MVVGLTPVNKFGFWSIDLVRVDIMKKECKVFSPTFNNLKDARAAANLGNEICDWCAESWLGVIDDSLDDMQMSIDKIFAESLSEDTPPQAKQLAETLHEKIKACIAHEKGKS